MSKTEILSELVIIFCSSLLFTFLAIMICFYLFWSIFFIMFGLQFQTVMYWLMLPAGMISVYNFCHSIHERFFTKNV